MRHYETTYILRPNLGEDQFTEIIERTNSLITNDGGAIIALDRWGMKKLAYEIKKEVQGYYVYVNYAAPGHTIEELERIFRIDDRLLRFLTIKLSDTMDEEAIAQEIERIAEAAAQKAAEEEAAEADQEQRSENAPAKKAEEKTEEQSEDAPAEKAEEKTEEQSKEA